MKIDFVLPASPIPGDMPPAAPVDTDQSLEIAPFSVALEAESLKALALVVPESKSDFVLATSVVQFLTADAEAPTPTRDLEPNIAEILEKTAAMPSLAGLIWNDARWQVLPTQEVPTQPGGESPELVSQPASAPLPTPPVSEPQVTEVAEVPNSNPAPAPTTIENPEMPSVFLAETASL